MKQVFHLLPVLLVIVSSCLDGGFSICDFKTICKSGLDKEFGGSCDFENHTCGWTDTSDDASYCWRRQMANITSKPGIDHTTGSPSGHVMHIDGKQGGMFPTATMEYSVDKLAALGCELSFWYYIYDSTSSSTISSSLKVTMIRGTTEKDLPITKPKTNSWENATAFIGNQPEGYKLQLSFKGSFFDPLEVMLDDISFTNCREGDVPEGSDQLSCEFEKDTCSWYHDYTASLLWKRSDGGFHEGPAGNGYYMLITATSDLNVSSVARLISFPRPAGQVICVSFLYHIFGNSIGSLRFVAKHSGEMETVVWLRSGTQGNKWRFADLTFKSDKPIQFIIEAVVGGTQGSIAIDNIMVSSSETGSCPAERECTFQGSLCGLLPEPSADFSWSRIRGTSQPANSSGPTTDHTLGTEQGYYLSAQLWSHSAGSRVAMMTAVMEATPSEGECLMFWYYMEGSAVGELSVYHQNPDNSSCSAQLWTRIGDQGKHWRHGRVTLLSPHALHQVIFEAVVGDGPRRDIAIDDLFVLNGACPPSGFCDFEMDFCGWVNSPPAEFGLEWDWLSGESENESPLFPQRDHTTNSALGHFAIFMHFKSDKNEKIAQLESEVMEAVDQACLEIWHYTPGWLGVAPSDITLTVFVKETAGLRPVWTTQGSISNKWIQNRVDFSASGPHQIILQASCPGSVEQSLALDDVHVIRNRFCNDSIPTTTSEPATTTTAAAASTMDCTFEQGLCNWVKDVSNDLNWTLTRGLEVDQPWDGPQYDHTVKDNQGFFILLNGSGSNDGERAAISVPVISPSSHICVGFWYYMLGPSVSTLDLLVKTKSSEELVWTRQGTQNPEWINAQVTISMNDIIQVMFTGHRNVNSKGFIAIDDIAVREGACSDQNVCSFESSLCDFENSHSGHWVREKGTKNEVDHTYGTKNGFYLTVMSSNSTQTEVAQLLTPDLTPGTEICVRFWYWLPAGSSNILAVHVLRNEEQGEALWQRSEGPSSGWEMAEVTVSSPVKFRVGFKADHVPGSNSKVKLDDVSVRKGACSPLGSCDFESGQCNWVNIRKADGHEWVMANGDFLGPPTDHTTQTPHGGFLLSSSLHQNHTSPAQILSEWIHLIDSTSCLTLWYHMDSSDSGTLKVYMRSEPSEEVLMFNSTSSGHNWTRFSQSVERNKPFQLLIEAEANNRGFIAIDDISVIPGLCQVNGTSLGFVGCSFENGTCGWEDISVGQCQWTRGRNASANTEPSLDHTLGTELGWYMTVQPYQGKWISPAALQSPTIKQASATCTLSFYYNMFGDDTEELNVVLKEDSRSTTLWWLSGNHGNLWHYAEVTVGRKPQHFTILFEACRAFINPGHVAIDYIDFINCTLPEPQPVCPEDMFKCNNNVCVGQNQVCDFSDDCGDWSDENNCEQQGVVERCSFEQGLCFWEKNDLDSPGAEWTLCKGQEAWPKHGPHRDHTKNSAAGHYVIPGTEMGQTSEILSKTLLPSSNCSVRFFYFSLDNAAAKLTARSRTLQSGSDDIVLWLSEDSQSYSWQRAEVTFSSLDKSKIVLRYERDGDPRGIVALDDISFSKECEFDPNNNQLPDSSTTSTPTTSSNTSTTTAILSTSTVQTPPTSTTQTPPTSTAQTPPTSTAQTPPTSTAQTPPTSTAQTPPTSTAQTPPTSTAQTPPTSTAQTPPTSTTQTPPTSTAQTLPTSTAQTPPTSTAQTPPTSTAQTPPTSTAQTLPTTTAQILPTSTAQTHACQADEFFCWRSAGKVCILAALQCDYHPDCPQGEDEDDCGLCSFERDKCQWSDTSVGQSRWQRQKASNNTKPPTDHTTSTGHYMRVNSTYESTCSEARLQSPPLPPSSLYCQILFHFHITAESAGSLRVLMQQADGSEAILWSRSHNTVSDWTSEYLPLGLHQQPYKVWFSSTNKGTPTDTSAVDDIFFVNCEKSYQPPALSTCGCSFEDGLCVWVQGAADELDWLSRSGPTETPNTGPAGDHTTGKGKYLYIKSSPPSVKGNMAQLKSPLLPPAGEKGYCFTFWTHMFGATVGTLRMNLQATDPLKKKLVWQKSGNQGDEWQLVQIHVTLQEVHQVILEATVEGEKGDIAIDDISLISGPCPASDICEFEEGSCNWQQETTDDFDWIRQSGSTPNPNTGPDTDHTTNTPAGYYFYIPSSLSDHAGQTAAMFSPLYPAGKGACVQLWYHMYGRGMGTLNVYQQSEEGKQELIFSQTGDQGKMWRFGYASLLPRVYPYRIVVEGVKSGPTQEGDMAFDDVQLTDNQCPSPGHCDFESNMCSWSNVGGVDQADWLVGSGATTNPNTAPSVDHTTNSKHGNYLYVDTPVGKSGDTSFLISDVFPPITRGHCLTFWYHMHGDQVGSLRVNLNDRIMHSGGNEEGILKWTEKGNKGDQWLRATVPVKHNETFWFVFVYQKGMITGGKVALDDLNVLSGPCTSEPPINPSDGGNDMSVGLGVGLTLLVVVLISIFIFILYRRHLKKNPRRGDPTTECFNNPVYEGFGCKKETIALAPHATDSNMASSFA